MFEIVAAHGIKYAATASVGYLDDFVNKIQKAKDCGGPAYIHVFAPCPTGWGGHGSEITISLAKEAVDSGLIYLAEYENGNFQLNKVPKEFAPVESYLSKQSRFKHLKEDEIKQIEKNARCQMGKKMMKEWA